MDSDRPVWAEIDLQAIRHNLGQVKNKTQAKIMAIVKANAYGHGAYQVAKTVLEAGADRLGVALLAEALELREQGIKAPVMILGYTPQEYAGTVVENEIIQTVFSSNQAQALAQAARKLNKEAVIHLKIDTGMSRIGFPWDKPEEIARIADIEGLNIEGAFTHFAVSDIKDKSFTRLQLERFLSCTDELARLGLDIKIKHAANSAAIIDMPEAHLDMVRPGIMLYGLAPSQEVDLASVDLQPAMTLKAKVALVKQITAGTTVSYGRTYTARKNTEIATLPLGYADGYSRLFSNKACVMVKGIKAPVVGRVCMDQCMIDVSNVPDVQENDEVVLFGRDAYGILAVDELAHILDTINYEIVCMVSYRIPRIYIN